MQIAAIPHIRGSLKRIIGAIAEELAAITRIRHILAKGSKPGQISSGILPLLVSFNATAIIVGTTTINEREIAIPLISICTLVPANIERVAGTTKGASKVSSKINVRPRALSPLKIVTQIKPETAVGPAKSKTKPVIISIFEKTREEEKRAAKGIIIWLVRKKSKIEMGSRTACPNSLAVSFNAPEKVIIPKSTITRGRKEIKTEGKNNPSATAKGVVTGINRSKYRLILRKKFLILILQNGNFHSSIPASARFCTVICNRSVCSVSAYYHAICGTHIFR